MEKEIIITIKDIDGQKVVRAVLNDTVCYRIPRKAVDADMADACNLKNTFLEDLSRAGVYILNGPRKKGTGKEVYVGQSDNVARRLYEHSCESGKDFWNECITFTRMEDDIESGHIEWLEKELFSMIRDKESCTLNNIEVPESRNIPATTEKCEQIFEEIKDLLSFIGPDINEQTVGEEYYGLNVKTIVFTRRDGETAKAAGHFASDSNEIDQNSEPDRGFIVHAGSMIAKAETPDCPDSIKSTRRELIKFNVVKEKENGMFFIQDRLFDTAGIAASVVLGRSAGEKEWK